ncbi:unnamed protein product [Bursaphelenchus xylophilus]|uniref:(pine wood nematode) hypothetical protein n=1 Tax=Bursaphelenchus xylophilus TaxID=6326 RepID=A0A1I7RIW0_BURXY|nr:unnamed protein product [Bursaphelenchus xylophilus]CAG9119128.1 unnamed protein product [Bursaphelenchus xylophilus]
MRSVEGSQSPESSHELDLDHKPTTSNEKLEMILQDALRGISEEAFEKERIKLGKLDEKVEWMECPQIVKLLCFFNTVKPKRVTITEDVPFFFPTHHKQGMRCMYKRRVFYETQSRTAGVNRWRCNQRGCRGTIYIDKAKDWSVIDSGKHWNRPCDCEPQEQDKLVAIAFKSIGYKLARLMPTESTKALKACVLALADEDQLGRLDNFDRVIRKNKRAGLKKQQALGEALAEQIVEEEEPLEE